MTGEIGILRLIFEMGLLLGILKHSTSIVRGQNVPSLLAKIEAMVYK